MAIQIASTRSADLGTFGTASPGENYVDFQLHTAGVAIAVKATTLAGTATIRLLTWAGTNVADAAVILEYTLTAVGDWIVLPVPVSLTSHRLEVEWDAATSLQVWAKGLNAPALPSTATGSVYQQLIPDAYDQAVYTYTASDQVSTVTYKLAGTTVRVLTLTYDVNDLLTDVSITGP